MESRCAEGNMNYWELSFESGPSITPQDQQLYELLKVLDGSTKETEQKRRIKQIVEVYKVSMEQKTENVEARNLVLEFFTRFNAKKVLKKYVQDLVAKFNLSTQIIKSSADEILGNIKGKKCCNVKQCNYLLNFIAIMQNSATFQYEATTECLFPVYYMIFEGFVFHAKSNFEAVSTISEEIFTLMNAVFKQILLVFIKNVSYIDVVAKEYSMKLVILSHAILLHETVGFDLKTKSGIVFTHSFNIIPEMHRKNFKYKDCPALEMLKEFNDEEYITLMNTKMSVFNCSESTVIIYSSILSIVPQEKLIEVKINDEALVCLLYGGLMECAKRNTSVPHIIVEISRTLSIIVKHLKAVPQSLIKSLFLEGISYVWSHLEHFVDTVRNYTKLFFEDLVIVAAQHKNNGNRELAEILLQNVQQLSPTQCIRLIAMDNIAQHMSASYLLENFDDLQNSLLCLISEVTISEQVCKTYMLAMEKHFQEIDQDEWTTLWVIPVTKLLKSCRHCAVACQRIIVRAFQLYPAILKIIFPRDYLGNSQESAVLIKCLQYARHNGVEVSINKKESAIYWRGLIDKDKLEKFMTHQNEEIRAAALASIIESQKTTEVFLDWEFEYLRKYLRYNITSPTPSFRKQIIAYYKKALTRYNAGFYVIVRNVAYLGKRLETMQDRQDVVRAHKFYQGLKGAYKAFIQKFTKQLIANLTFDSNYWRRATTLELLLTVDRFMSMEEWHACWTEDDVKNCHGMLFDCFETNKKMALQLLKNLPPASMGFTNVEFTFKYMQRCLNMALDIKPSKTLSAAYLLQICACSPNFYDIVQYGNNEGGQRQLHNSTLDMLIVLTGKLISESTIKVDIANTKTAHYGIILSIRHLLEHRDINKNNDAYSGLFEHLVTICLNLKEDIMPVVCNPSPEGYLPDPGDELCAADDSARAQSVLLYAWRTMKEMTLLLAEIARQTIKLEGTVEMLSEDLLVKIGQLFVDIFVQSKHRGVFEHAYNGFYVICESFWISTNPNINALPKTWLREAIYLCTGQKQSDQLCATRRSAGLPFLILSVLSSESPLNKPYFNESIKTILDVCDNLDPSNNECRIHSMNVLRYMFRHSRLGELIVPHIGVGVKAAIVGFKSDTWGVRNSATLLYAALVTRMFGVQRTHDCEDLPLKNRLTIRVFFMRFPELSQFLLSTLKEECDKCDSLTLHPVLMILSRLYPANLEEYNTQVEEYLLHVNKCLSHPNCKTRELAAKASISFIHNFDVLKRLENCFDRIGQPDIKDNECHGLLTQVWCLLKTGTKLPEVPLTSYFYNSIYLLQQVGRKFSHHTVSLYMEVIMLLLSKFRKYDDLDMLKGILTLLSRQIASNLLPVTAVSRFPQTRLLLVLYIAVNKFEECDATYPTITNQIMSFLYGHDSEMKRFCLYLLIAMNHTQNDAATKHPLFVTEEMQIPQQIQALMDTFDKGSVTRILTHIHPYLKCFLTEELKFQHYIKREDQVLFFLLVIYYPCVIKYLNLSKQETLNLLIKYCDCDNEELISAVVGCISTFLLQLDYNVLRYDKLVPVLAESASPAASEYRRLAVCDFLVKNYILYCNEERILSADDLQMILNIVMVLLEDDDLTVRNAMSDFATTLKVRIMLNDTPKQTISSQRWPVIPEKAREDLLHLSTKIMPKDSAVCFLFSWACRHFPDVSNDASEVFQRGELNMYAENVAFIDLCACLLYNLLWPLEDGLNYADNSIFIEEQTLIVTTVLLDSLLKNPSPMMLYKTKLSSTFSSEFRVYLEETILGYLTKHVEHVDLFSVKRIMRNIYEPVLNYRVPRT